ncbi:hypothetical protein [Variovorax boronicumulans]|uniref:hypothetical protein n=1 Tax=Variovorax boronicumulans TaxID=436515 RepID=UPI0012E51CB6|nr:hypothetical protein [Variovorax boronicumulans]GER17531.1 hypothetical protein VCH24_25460 [Variovorax boronicumulans]
MLDLGSTNFVLAVPSVPEQELQQLSSALFDSWESFVERSVSVPDYSLFLQVEEGSVKGLAKIGATLGAIYLAIGNYGDFVSGVKTIGEQVVSTGDYLTERASQVFSCPPSRASSKKRGGSLAALQRLFVKVQRGELTPDEAMIRAETLLGDDAYAEPGFMITLASALRNCPHYHQQQPFPFLEQDEEVEAMLESRPHSPRPLKPSPPDLGPFLHLRVEVWRESKKKQKQTRIVKL